MSTGQIAFAAVIFDMDGVITHSEPIHVRAEQDVCREFGLEVPLAEWANFRGRTAADIFGYLAANFGADRPDLTAERMISRKTVRYVELCRTEGLPAIPGAVEFVRWSRGFFPKVGLATSSNSVVQGVCFDTLGLGPYFDAVVTGDDLTRGKPDPQAYLLAARQLAVNPVDCLVIEDSDNGVRAGKAAGCVVAGITTEFSRTALLACGADLAVDRFEELRSILIAGRRWAS